MKLAAFVFAGAALACQANSPWSVQLPASSSPINTNFSAYIRGSSPNGVYSINVNDNKGQVVAANHTINLVVKDQIPFGGDLVLYSLLGVTDAGIVTSWAYCNGSKLTTLWLESTQGNAAFTPSTVTGACTVTNNSATVDLDSTAECIDVVAPKAVPTINGTDIVLHNGSVGRTVIGSEDYHLLPYALVDCSDCGSTADEGWFEVHSVLESITGDDVCVGIFYLYTSCHDDIPLDYVQCLKGNATSTYFSASYNLSPVSNKSDGGSTSTCNANAASSSAGAGSASGSTSGSASGSTPGSSSATVVSQPHYIVVLGLVMVLALVHSILL